MRRMATMVCLALVTCAGVSHAQADFHAGLCDAPTYSITTTCTSNTGTIAALYGTILQPTATIAGFYGTESVVDITSSSATVPDWWRIDACRAGSLVVLADATITGASGCPTLWDGHPTPVTQVVTRYPGFSNQMFQLIIDSTLPEADAFDLPPTPSDLYVFQLVIDRAKSTGTGSCSGCVQGACIRLRDVAMRTLSDPSGEVARIRTPRGPHDFIGATVTFQSGAPACGGSVPVRNETWGTLKSLYR